VHRTYHGSCHCGRVAFELDASLDTAVECNCSVCRRRATLWHGTSDEHFRITRGEDALTLYQFGTMTAKHWFCRHCGIHPFARPRLAPDKWVVNVRCLDGVDVRQLKIIPFDGEHWDEAAPAFVAKLRAAQVATPV